MKTAIESYLNPEEHCEREKREDQERWERYELTDQAISHEGATVWLSKLAQGDAV